MKVIENCYLKSDFIISVDISRNEFHQEKTYV